MREQLLIVRSGAETVIEIGPAGDMSIKFKTDSFSSGDVVELWDSGRGRIKRKTVKAPPAVQSEPEPEPEPEPTETTESTYRPRKYQRR